MKAAAIKILKVREIDKNQRMFLNLILVLRLSALY